MIPESYARIYMRNDKVGLHLVCEKKYDFIIYDKQILSMVSNLTKYRRVKYRNAKGKEAIGYPAGEIWGKFETYNDDTYGKIIICIGPNGEDIEIDEVTKKPINLVKEHVFLLPLADFKKFAVVLKLMKEQKELFTEFLEGAEMEVGI
jgi:hypothetical protein